MVHTICKSDFPIHFRDSGKGDALVFLHGHLEALDIWGDFPERFLPEFRVICVDLPGHGGSGLLTPVSGMDVMAGVVKSVLDHLDIQQATILGHSMGGYTALAALELYPGIFKAISLFHSHPLPDSLEVAKKREREIRIIKKGLKRLLVNQNIPNMYAADNLDKFHDEIQRSKTIAHGLSDEGVIAAIRGLKARQDRSQVLKNASVPCLNIIGKKDNYIDFDEVSMKTKLPDGSMRWVLENSGHMGFIEEPERAQEGIIQFLNSIG